MSRADVRGSAAVPSAPGATLAAHIDDLREFGARVCRGARDTFWVASHNRVARRLPVFSAGAPEASELDGALEATGALVTSYLREPDAEHPANAWLYLCTERDYSLTMRPPTMRRNVRRALRELTIRQISPAELLAHGATAFSDTRRRTGLNDGTIKDFRRRFTFNEPTDSAGRSFLGAWKDGALAAFATVLPVDDWVELGCFSMDSMLRYRPNEALLYVALSHYLTERKCRVVSFGLSSIQASSNAAGLHRFKVKVGFAPHPVHRAFVFHPSIRPFVTPATLSAAHWAVNGMLRVWPRNGALKRFDGLLACMRGATWMMHAADGSHERARLRQPHLSSKPLCTT